MFNQKAFGMTIRRLRKERHLSLQMFADKCGLSVFSIQSYQFDRQSPSTKAILKICTALKISPNVLFESMYTHSTELEHIAVIDSFLQCISEDEKIKIKENLSIIVDCMEKSYPRLDFIDFGARLRIFRQDAGISVKDFSSRCNIVTGTLTTMESNQGLPGIDLLLLICKELQISPEFLLINSCNYAPLSDRWYKNLTPRQISCLAELIQRF